MTTEAKKATAFTFAGKSNKKKATKATRDGMKTRNAPEYIHQYILKNVNGRRQVVGVFVAKRDEKKVVKIGWSKVNAKAGDKFDKEVGLNIALGRTNANTAIPIPPSIFKDACRFKNRCQRYFKDAVTHNIDKDIKNEMVRIEEIDLS